MHISTLLPKISVFENYFKDDELRQIREFFHLNSSFFNYTKDEDSGKHNNCFLKIWKIQNIQLPIIKTGFEAAFQAIIIQNQIKTQRKLKLNFREIF